MAINLCAILKNVAYNNISKENVCEIFGLQSISVNDNQLLPLVINSVQKTANSQKFRFNLMLNYVQTKWKEYGDKYFETMQTILKFNIEKNIIHHTFCYIQPLPINEVDLKDYSVYLDGNQSKENVFKTFIILLTKALVIEKWSEISDMDLNIDFDYKNKLWLFAELAVDAILYNSELNVLSNHPSYKYFYNLKIDNINFMEKFRKDFKIISIEEHLTNVYMFVRKNYQRLIQFKHYLY